MSEADLSETTPLRAASTEGWRVFVAAARSRRFSGNAQGGWDDEATPLRAASTAGRRVFVAAARSRRFSGDELHPS